MTKCKATDQGKKVALPHSEVGKWDGCGEGERGWGRQKKFITSLPSHDTPFLVWQIEWIYLSSPGSKASFNHWDLEGQNVSTLRVKTTDMKTMFSQVISQLCPHVYQIIARKKHPDRLDKGHYEEEWCGWTPTAGRTLSFPPGTASPCTQRKF